MAAGDRERLLRWYPEPWRRRYGAELLAMVEDTTGGAEPGRRLRWSLLVAGGRERVRRSWLVGPAASPEGRVRGGAGLVLWGWALMLPAGFSFAKLAEHWQDAVPAREQALPRVALDGAAALAIAAAAVLAATTAAAWPGFARALRAGAWGRVRRAAVWAAGLLGAWIAVTAAVAVWARHLTVAERNGGSGAYGAAFLGWGLVTLATVAAWTRLAIRAERQVPFTPRLLRVEQAGAVALTVLVAGITAFACLWWAGIARAAPWFLQGRASGVPSSAWTWRLGTTALAMLAATALSAAGVARMAGARRSLRAG